MYMLSSPFLRAVVLVADVLVLLVVAVFVVAPILGHAGRRRLEA
jgi:hypothetical protein